MDTQYLDWYFVHLTYELEASRDRFSDRSQSAMLSDTRGKSRRLLPAISKVAAVLRNVQLSRLGEP